ncbi:hypothetical protein SVAN01_05520 [Stagonosporopsis vannaccii]|nr:hypothetical protein SVAN01_05520 [Stagonosporopsis vannaccii]
MLTPHLNYDPATTRFISRLPKMDLNDTKYQYQPLDGSQQELRLVRLLPAQTNDGLIAITLYIFSLSKAPVFDACSYRWGSVSSASSPHTIICDGAAMQVGHNLYLFLQAVAKGLGKERYLWIDAICIDQSNVSEGIHLMSQIYIAAERTLCWTGCVDLTPLVRFISLTKNISDGNERLASATWTTDCYHSSYKIVAKDLINPDTLKDQSTRVIQLGVDEFLGQDYFKRSWMLQDIFFSANPLIFDGNISIAWKDLSHALLFWLLHNTRSIIQSPSMLLVIFSGLLQVDEIKASPDVKIGMNNIRRCQDERNNMFVWFPWLDSFQNLAIDYNCSAEKIYEQISSALNSLAGQALNFTFPDNSIQGPPLWSLGWIKHKMRLALNHPASKFSALPIMANRLLSKGSPELKNSTVSPHAKSSDHNVLEQAPGQHFYLDHTSDNQYNLYVRGLVVDVVIEMGDYQPSRRHFDEDMEETATIRLFYAARFPSHDRKFAITKSKRYCLVPEATKKGDLVCIPSGSRVPYILQPETATLTYRIIGESYVHGLMHGEAIELVPEDWRDFDLS